MFFNNNNVSPLRSENPETVNMGEWPYTMDENFEFHKTEGPEGPAVPILSDAENLPRKQRSSARRSSSIAKPSRRRPSERKTVNSFPLTNLPDVPLRKIISYLDPEDLRAFHQVSLSWKAALENHSNQDRRRTALVEEIREDKENLLNGNKNQEPPPVVQHSIRRELPSGGDGNGSRKKNGYSVLMDRTNNYKNKQANHTPVAHRSRRIL